MGFKKETFEYFKKTVIANHLDIYLFDRVVYNGNEEIVVIGCKKHKFYFPITPVTLLRRTQRNGGKKKNPIVGSCPICKEEYFKKIKVDFINKCKKAHNNEYTYGEYINHNTPLTVYCKIHGKFVVKKPYNHSVGMCKCPECYPKKYFNENEPYDEYKKYSNEIKINEIPNTIKFKRYLPPKFIYENNKKYYVCLIHGKVVVGFNRNYSQGCPTCNIEKRKTNPKPILNSSKKINKGQIKKISYEEAKERVNENGIKSHSEYRSWIKRTNQIDLPSNPERVYKDVWVDYYEFFNSDRSKSLSNGAQRIYNYLMINNIEFEMEKTFINCKNINHLRFDFYIPKHNLCVEFDGEQHYKVTNFHNDPEVNKNIFENVKINDEIKNKYCEDNNIHLFRIPYWELNENTIEWGLSNELTRVAAINAIADLAKM